MINRIIKNNNWRFAITYKDSHPHEYIVKSKCSSKEDFEELCEYIKNNGHYEYFFKIRGVYCSIGDYTYWVMGDVINRRWNDMYYTDERNQIQKVEKWKELLQDGRVLYK